jgi:Spy/CpxP family protein refolding chaperone
MKTYLFILTLALVSLCAPAVSAADKDKDKGGIAFILDHGKELKLEDEQKKKLNNMRALEERTRIKAFSETDMKVILHRVLEAKRKNDEATMSTAYAELVERLVQKTAPVAKAMMDEIGKTLSPEQLEKVNTLKEEQDGKKTASEKKEESQSKPKRGSTPPNPFEF